MAWHSHCWPKFHPIKIVELLLAPALLNRPWECLNVASTSLYISPFYCSDVAVVPTLRLLASLKSGSSFRWLPLALMIWSFGCFPRLEGRVRRSFPDKLISCTFSSFTMSLKRKVTVKIDAKAIVHFTVHVRPLLHFKDLKQLDFVN